MHCANEALSTSDFNLNTTASTQTKSECRLEEAVMAQETRSAAMQDSPADVRAREVEEQMTDDERFSLLVRCAEKIW